MTVSSSQPHPPVLSSILAVLKAAGEQQHEITRTKLVKLLYFADLTAVEAGSAAFTGATWRWDNYGPYDHALRRSEDTAVVMKIVDRDDQTKPWDYGACYLSLAHGLGIDDPLPAESMNIIRDVVREYGGASAGRLKDLSYKTPPMIEATTAGDRNVLLDLSRARRRVQVEALRGRVRRSRRGRLPQTRDDHVVEELRAEYECAAPSIRRVNRRDFDGKLVYADDSGCSCPSPFEDQDIPDLTLCTATELQAHLTKQAERASWGEPIAGEHAMAIANLMARVIA